MPSNKSKKKSLLQGALKKELKGDGLMHDFIKKNVQNEDNSKAENHTGESSSEPEDSASQAQNKREQKRTTRRKITDNNQTSIKQIEKSGDREWWLSFSAFMTVVALIVGIYYFASSPAPNSFIHLSNSSIELSGVEQHSNTPRLDSSLPIYFYFISAKPIDSNYIDIQVYKTNLNNDDRLIVKSQRSIKPYWKAFRTHFQKEYFEQTGNYRIILEDDKRQILSTQVFSVSR